jgi:uridine kinase
VAEIGAAASDTIPDVELVDRLAARVEALLERRDRALVAVDGPDAAGKSTLADRVAARVAVPALRASVDGFHHPRAVRRRRGSLSAEGYYRDSFDDEALVEALLEPFASGAAQVRTQAFDHLLDAPPR